MRLGNQAVSHGVEGHLRDFNGYGYSYAPSVLDRARPLGYHREGVRVVERIVARGLLPEERRVDQRSGKSFETCDTPLRLSPGSRNFNGYDYSYFYAPSVLEGPASRLTSRSGHCCARSCTWLLH